MEIKHTDKTQRPSSPGLPAAMLERAESMSGLVELMLVVILVLIGLTGVLYLLDRVKLSDIEVQTVLSYQSYPSPYVHKYNESGELVVASEHFPTQAQAYLDHHAFYHTGEGICVLIYTAQRLAGCDPSSMVEGTDFNLALAVDSGTGDPHLYPTGGDMTLCPDTTDTTLMDTIKAAVLAEVPKQCNSMAFFVIYPGRLYPRVPLMVRAGSFVEEEYAKGDPFPIIY